MVKIILPFDFLIYKKTMTYRTDHKIRRSVKGYGFMSFAKNIRSKYGKKIINKGISAASKLNQSKYGKIPGKKILTKSAEGNRRFNWI